MLKYKIIIIVKHKFMYFLITKMKLFIIIFKLFFCTIINFYLIIKAMFRTTL